MKLNDIPFLRKYKIPLLITLVLLVIGTALYVIIGVTMSEKWLSEAWEVANGQGHVTKITDENIELIHDKVKMAAFFGNAEAKLYSNMPSVKILKSILHKAENGNAYAQFAVGFFLRFPTTFVDKLAKEDYKKAKELSEWLVHERAEVDIVEYMWFLKAAEQGHSRAQQFIDLYPEEKKKYEEFQRDWEAAHQGDPKAMYAMSLYYSYPDNPVVRNDQEALRWTEKAANAGCAEALYDLADAYIGGFGSSTRLHLGYNREKAFALFRKAAELGNVDAFYGLGRCYEEALGVKRNLKEAEKWLEKAVAAGGGRNAYKASNHLSTVRYNISNEQRIKRGF